MTHEETCAANPPPRPRPDTGPAHDTAPAPVTALHRPASSDAGGRRRRNRIAVVVAHNEETTVVGVLERLRGLVDEVIVVDDGSTDATRSLVADWLHQVPPGVAQLHAFDRRHGTSAGFHLAFSQLRDRLSPSAAGGLNRDDLIVTVDASGQHDLDVLSRLGRRMADEKLDAVVACRDLTIYPFHKQLGNTLLSAWATLWASGTRLHDVKSGYRLLRLGALAEALDYWSGSPQSDNAELAVLMSRLGHRVRNDILVPVPYYRSGTRAADLVADLLAIPLAACRVTARPPADRAVPGLAGPVAVTAGLLSLALFVCRRVLRPRVRRATASPAPGLWAGSSSGPGSGSS